MDLETDADVGTANGGVKSAPAANSTEHALLFTRQPGVEEFASYHQLHHPIDRALGLARRHFPAARSMRAFVASDPESEARWLTLAIRTVETPENTRRQFDAFSSDWIDEVPFAARRCIVFTFEFSA